jgi:CHAT domain-containing protein
LTHDYLSSIKKSKHPRFIQKAHLLYQLFIEPVKKHLKEKDKLIIIPEANLLSIPFGALLTEKKAITTPYSQLPYLIKRYEIQYNYSASLWHASHSTPPVKLKRKLLAFAPVFDNKEGYVIDANILKANKTHNPNNERGAIDMLTKTWKTLAHSKTEVDSITHLFLKNGHKYSKALIRTKASEANFKKYCANYQFLHLATHSQVNKKTPALSYVAFTPDSTINKNEDGNLYLEEIHNLRLNTKLVVLSSCDSGVGKLEAGEGVISLSRAFLHAGAQNILFSLWSVNDKATKNQMLHFYANILNNASYSKALHTAKLKMIKTLKVAKPYFWAGFIFIGK